MILDKETNYLLCKCNEHGEFEIDDDKYALGFNCPRCETLSTLELVYGEITIKPNHLGTERLYANCSKHGEYQVIEELALKGYGCPSCSEKNRKAHSQYLFDNFKENNYSNEWHMMHYYELDKMYVHCNHFEVDYDPDNMLYIQDYLEDEYRGCDTCRELARDQRRVKRRFGFRMYKLLERIEDYENGDERWLLRCCHDKIHKWGFEKMANPPADECHECTGEVIDYMKASNPDVIPLGGPREEGVGYGQGLIEGWEYDNDTW